MSAAMIVSEEEEREYEAILAEIAARFELESWLLRLRLPVRWCSKLARLWPEWALRPIEKGKR